MPTLVQNVIVIYRLPTAVQSLPPGTSSTAAKKKAASESVSGQSISKGASAATPFKDKLKWYCSVTKKNDPTVMSEKVKGTSRKYVGKAYIPQTCGWITGDPKKTKGEAEEDAAAKLVARLKITS